MSSSLQAQLAAIDAKNKNPGSTYASSTRHEEAVGRGADFSVQHGRHVDRAAYKPSLIQTSAKAAADIPLWSLQENCRESLTALARFYPQVASTTILAANVTPEAVQEMMLYVTVLLGERKVGVQQQCLHVLEYMIRRFEIHKSNMEDLVWALLPHHDRCRAVCHRTLQLVDLASQQSYLWLRPYATAEATLVPRATMARHVMKHGDLQRRILKMASQAQALPPCRGASYILSFTVAVIVEGFQYIDDDKQEAFVRILLPAVAQACAAADHVEWNNWGYILASTMVERLDVTPVVIEELVRCMLANVNTRPLDAVAAVLSILTPPTVPRHEESYLPLLRGNLLGCDLPHAAVEALMAVENLPAILGALAEGRRLAVEPLLGSLIAQYLNRMSHLIVEPGLRSVWRDPTLDLVASTSALIVVRALGNDTELAPLKETMGALGRVDHGAKERGVAHILGCKASLAQCARKRLMDLLDMKDAMDVDTEDASDSWKLLPPAIALEHADTGVRQGAIERLRRQIGSGEEVDGVFESLLHRWSADDDVDVATAAIKAALSVVETFGTNADRLDMDLVLKSYTSGFRKWMLRDNKELHSAMLSVSKHMLKSFSTYDTSSDAYNIILVAAVACFAASSGEDGLRDVAGSVFQGSESKKGRSPRKGKLDTTKLSAMIFGGGSFLRFLSARLTQSGDSDLLVQRAAMTVSQLCVDSKSLLIKNVDNLTDVFVVACDSVGRLVDGGDRRVAAASLCLRLTKDAPTYISRLQKIALVFKRNVLVERILPDLLALSGAEKSRGLHLLLEASLLPSESQDALLEALVSIAQDVSCNDCQYLLIVAICSLVASETKSLRNCAVHLARICSNRLSSSAMSSSSAFLKCVVNNSSQCAIGGDTLLCDLLRQAAQQTLRKGTRRALPLVEYLVAFVDSLSSVSLFKESSAALDTLAAVLADMESAGESTYPLLGRWEQIGQYIFEKLVSVSSEMSVAMPGYQKLSEVVCQMLKGVVVHEDRIIISSGPRRDGGRSRSYSVGKSDAVSVIQRYPTSMCESLARGLRADASGSLAPVVSRIVFGSSTWREHVFSTLSTKDRKELANQVLDFICGDAQVGGESLQAFLLLPMNGEEIAGLMRVSIERMDCIRMSFVADHVHARHRSLMSSAGSLELVQSLLDAFITVRRNSELDDDSFNFSSMALLRSAAAMVSEASVVGKGARAEKAIRKWSHLVEEVLQEAIKGESRPLTHRARSDSLLFVERLAQLSPKSGIDGLHRLVDSVIESFGGQSGDTRAHIEMLRVFVPAHMKAAKNQGLSLSAMMASACTRLGCFPREDDRVLALSEFLKAVLRSDSASTDEQIAFVGVVLSVFVAGSHVRKDLSTTEIVNTASSALESLPTSVILQSMTILVDFAISLVPGSEVPMLDNRETIVGGDIRLAVSASPDPILDVIGKLIRTVLLSEEARTFIQRCESTEAPICLSAWQAVLSLHGLVQALSSDTAFDMTETFHIIEEAKELFQSSLPAHLFLASVASLIQGEKEELPEVRTRALRLLSDRAEATDPRSADAQLLIELLPAVVNLVGSSPSSLSMDDRTLSMMQALFIAVEHIARILMMPLGDEKYVQDHIRYLSACMHKMMTFAAVVVQSFTNEIDPGDEESVPRQQLLVSVALCGATLFKVLKVKALPFVASCVDTFSTLLAATNSTVASFGNDARSRHLIERGESLQLSTTRLFVSLVDSMAPFLPVHLPKMVSKATLLHKHLRESKDTAIRSYVLAFDDALCAKIDIRVLVSSITKTIGQLSPGDDAAAVSVLRLVLQSVSSGNPLSVISQRNRVFRIITKILDVGTDVDFVADPMIDCAAELFTALILRISEVQLRELFAMLKDWKGTLNEEEPSEGARRRYAFWCICARMSSQLRSIFLPCLSLASKDLISELQWIASIFKQTTQIISIDAGRKKRRIALEGVFDARAMSFARPMMQCLEISLRSDSYDGGDWIRVDNNVTFHSILEPLGRLLQTYTTQNFMDENAYEYLIDGDEGCVVSCLSALASAAGNETLWKPLNHIVLEACGSEDRVEVRRAGLHCLSSLVKSLGEEYLVLLPECLPVLSELLEDRNDENAGLARGIIALAEETLGESLEDNLR